MKEFSLIVIDAVKGKQKFYKLVKDGVCQFDEFESKARINYDSEMTKVFAIMDKVADLQSLPNKMFRDITPGKEQNKEYEIKTKHLRVYLFHEKLTGKVISVGGYKTTQQSDIKHFREIKKEYFLRS